MGLGVLVFRGGINHISFQDMTSSTSTTCITYWNNECNKYSVLKNLEVRSNFSPLGWNYLHTVMWI